MDTSKDISREDLTAWLKQHAQSVGWIFKKPPGLRPFLYTRSAGGGAVEVMRYVKDGDDVVMGTIAVPPGAHRNDTVMTVLRDMIRAHDRWWSPPAPGRMHAPRQTQPYPVRPQNARTLFYVVMDATTGRYLTYPGCDAVRTFPVRPEAEAACENAGRSGRYHRVMRVTQDGDDAYDSVAPATLERRGDWYYQAQCA
jgi:hypothetical protein